MLLYAAPHEIPYGFGDFIHADLDVLRLTSPWLTVSRVCVPNDPFYPFLLFYYLALPINLRCGVLVQGFDKFMPLQCLQSAVFAAVFVLLVLDPLLLWLSVL